MCSKKKIRQINAKRKPTKGIHEGKFYSSNVKAVEKFKINECIARTNVSTVYQDFIFITSSIEPNSFNFFDSSEYIVTVE